MLLILLQKHWKKVLILLGVLALFVSGYLYGRSSVSPEVQTITKEVVKEIQVERKSEATNHVVTRTTQKDGTVIEKVEDIKVVEQSSSHESSKESEKTVTPLPPAAKNWRAGLMADWQPTLQTLIEFKKPELSYDINLSRRIVWNIWADSKYNFSTKTVGLGASIEF